jgi:hypothetical protein
MRKDSAGRERAAALGRVVDKIVCRFRHTEPKTPSRYAGKSFLETVEIHPVAAESIVTMEAQPGRG